MSVDGVFMSRSSLGTSDLTDIERDTTCSGADSTQADAVQEELANQGLPQDKNAPYDYKVATDHQDAFSMESDLVSLYIDYDMDWGS